MYNRKEIDEYRENLKSNRKSEKTIIEYTKDIERFFKYINKNIKDITNEDIEKYKDYMMNEKKLKVTTINRTLVSLDTFFKFHQLPVLIVKIKVQSQNFLDDVLTSKDIDLMIEKAKQYADYRFIAYISTLKFTGARSFEAVQINIEDIGNNTIQIIGKGDKVRNLFIPTKLTKIWNEYLPYRKTGKTNALFTSNKGRCSTSLFRKNIKKYGRMAEIKEEKIHLHNARHMTALSLSKKGLPIETIADICGHSQLTTTAIYTRRSKQELLDIANTL